MEYNHGIFPSIREEFAGEFAGLERMMVFERSEIYCRYLNAMGPVHLRVFVLCVEVMNLHDKVYSIFNQQNKELPPDLAFNERLSKFKEKININSGELIDANVDDIPDNDDVNVLTELLRQIARLAHPIFFSGKETTAAAEKIIRNARKAFRDRQLQRLKDILTEAKNFQSIHLKNVHKNLHEVLKHEIAHLRADREKNMLIFPLSLRYRVHDHEWKNEEISRLLNDEKYLLNLKAKYEEILKISQ